MTGGAAGKSLLEAWYNWGLASCVVGVLMVCGEGLFSGCCCTDIVSIAADSGCAMNAGRVGPISLDNGVCC